MARNMTSQWEFGDLFAKPRVPARRVLSVSELTWRIKDLLEQNIGSVWVEGEVSNLRTQSSGHLYFTLKDAATQLSCVLFRGTPARNRSAIRDGRRLVLQGELTVYEPRGQYQFIVRQVEVQGLGALQAAFERLKQRLNAEGLFDPARKRPIPRFPVRVGLVTSPSGAAIRDVVHVMERRFAGIELILAPCRVQGQGAEREIAGAIRRLNALPATGSPPLDVILITRGGGSLEDLWVFNEECVARAIAASAVPVVSAVGHEIDFTIADFVADLRAATPSAAAELLTAGYVEARDWLVRQSQRLRRMVDVDRDRRRRHLTALAGRLSRAHPRRKLNQQMQRLDEAECALLLRVRDGLQRRRDRLAGLVVRLAFWRPDRQVRAAREQLERRLEDLHLRLESAVRAKREKLERLALRLRLLSPDEVLARGYSITLDATTSRIIRQAEDLTSGQRLRTRLHQGEVTSVVVSETRDHGTP